MGQSRIYKIFDIAYCKKGIRVGFVKARDMDIVVVIFYIYKIWVGQSLFNNIWVEDNFKVAMDSDRWASM